MPPVPTTLTFNYIYQILQIVIRTRVLVTSEYNEQIYTNYYFVALDVYPPIHTETEYFMNERNRAILLIGIILSSLSGVYLYQGYSHYTSLMNQVLQVTEDKFNAAIDSVQEFSFTPYTTRVNNLLSNSPEIVMAFAERDRELLYQRTLSKYEALLLENKYFQVMHFHLPDGTTLLRMHNPDFYGDDLNEMRPIITAVHRDRKPLSGYEIGRHGPFYRIVHPVFQNDTYIGALEFGIKVHELIDVVEKKVESPVSSFFREELLQKATHFHTSDYIQFGKLSLLTHGQEIYHQLPNNLNLNKGDQQISINDQTFAVHIHPLFKNYQGELVGGITVLQDITPFLLEQRIFMGKSIAFLLLMSVLAFIGLYFGFGKITASLVDEIEKRKKAQAAATKAKQEWERTVDAVPDLITILDKDYRIVRTNNALPDMLQLPMDKILGSQCYQIFCGKDKPPEHCPYRTLQDNKQSCSNEIYYAKLGYYFDVVLAPLYDENSDFIGAVHVARDISQRKRLEQQIKENNLYLRSILEASTNTAIVATDAKMQIKYCNPETERLLGYPADSIINRPIADIHTDKGITIASDFEKAMDQAQQYGFSRFPLHNGEYILDAQISTLTDEQGNFSGLLLMGKDVTAQKKAENKLLKAEKFEAIGLMAGGIAHDLNNILSGVVSYPELLRYQLPAESDMHQPLLQIQKAGKRAADVVADLLTMARGVARVKKIVCLNDLVLEYLSSPECGKLVSLYPKISIDIQHEKNLWNCQCSPTHIIKIVMNLVTNAVEAIAGSGRVIISTHNQESSPHPAGDSLEDSEFVVLQVQDTGSGIPEHHLKHIFEPFYSTKIMGRSGSGLGLSIVWNTIQEHGGVTTVSSDENGTIFTLYLPVCKERVVTKDTTIIDRLEMLKGKGTILIVDDDEDQRIIAQKILSGFGYTTHTVSSGEEAVSWCQKNNVDLILLDMVMNPGINGRETYEKIISFRPEQKALIASGLAKDSEVERAIQLGVKTFIVKPYSLEELGGAIGQVMNS